jgi:four helix bundle protein
MDEACIEIIRKRNFGLANQMRNAAISVVSNISEGFDRRSPPSFRYFLLVAKGSVAELRAQLYLCEDRAYLEPSTLASLQEKATTVSRMLWGLIRYLEQLPTSRANPQRGTRNAERGIT